MHLTVNGKSESMNNVQTVADLLSHFDLPPVRVAVEVNQELVPRAQFDQSRLHEGDNVEIVTLVGGG